MARIGFVGLGNMGWPMFQNLVKAGHSVKGFDIAPDAARKVATVGGQPAGSIGETCGAEIIISMLPSGQQVKEVYLGTSGILEAAKRGTLLIDCSTIDIESARSVAAEARGRGFEMLDAPVSGGVGGAQAGTLTFMVGGTDTAFAKAKPVLESMGTTIVHAGKSGNGQAAKIRNNMIVGISMIAVSEAFVLAEKLGLDARKFFDVASKSSGQCWAMTTYCPVPGARSRADLAGQPRLSGGIYRRHDAQGPEPCPRRSAVGEGIQSARRRGGTALQFIRVQRSCSHRLFRYRKLSADFDSVALWAAPSPPGFMISRTDRMMRVHGQSGA